MRATYSPARRTPATHLYALLLLALLVTPFALGQPQVAAAARIPFPTYVYAIASGPYTYDLIVNKAGTEKRLSRIGVAGVGLTDIAVQLAPGGERVAVRLSGNAAGGSSLRVVEISSSKSVTTTLRNGGGEGVGAFAWSPDGKTLAYTLAAPQRIDADSGVGTVWVVNYDGKWPRKIAGRGADRLIGWSPDGSGLYVQRVTGTGADQTSSLSYYHLAGDSRQVLSGGAGLNYKRFAVSGAPLSAAPIGAGRISAVAAGYGGATAVESSGAGHGGAATARTVSTPTLLVGDGFDVYKPVQGNGEDYAVLAWAPDGYHVLASGGQSGKSWLVDANTGQRWQLPTQVNNLKPISWTADSRYALMAPPNGPATTLMILDTISGKLNSSRSVGKAAAADDAVRSLVVPYISQVWDTNNKVNGVWACGPTSVAMVLAAYGRLEPWPLAQGSSRSSSRATLANRAAGAEAMPAAEDGTLYAQYVTDAFSYKGRSFAATSKDPNGRQVAGLYGYIVGSDSLAHWEKMISVLQLYQLDTAYLPVTWSAITAALDKGFPVIIGTNLTADGHILVAKGYTRNGYLIAQDPYGNKWGAQGYGGPDGQNVAYPWRKLTAKMALQVKGTVWMPTPTPTPTEAATATTTATPTAAATATSIIPIFHDEP